uniref:Uncharacterized protein n=1 Tax=Acrobeloides nanus TaxID=290746 RepID=A0A914E5C7_9BILA
MLRPTIVLLAFYLIGLSALNLQKRDTAQLIKNKFEDFKENCFPRGSLDGCKCTIKSSDGTEEIKTYDSDTECKKPVEIQTMENKAELNKEFEQKYGNMKENCFPRPGKGCRCVEKDASGNEVERRYEEDSDCKVPQRVKRERDYNVRDPVREQAQQNYQAVVNELKDKFRGLKEGCYPRPRGCLCVIGKDSSGREITQRRMKDSDCKCQPGEHGQGCPAAGA